MSAKFTDKDVPDLTGYVAIVTGGLMTLVADSSASVGNGGIGYETTKVLAQKGARVYIAGRSAERVNKAITDLNKLGKPLDLHFLQLDLLDLKSVKAAAASFNAQEETLDILINNAGDGYETQWQANYVAPHLLTTSLLPKLLSTAARYPEKTRVRVVNVASDLAFFGPKTIDMKDPNLTNTKGLLELHQRYGHSKQAIIRDAFELNTRYASQGVTAYALHPGIVASGLQGSDPRFIGKVTRVLSRFSGVTPLQGALNSLYAATSPSAPKTGAGNFYMPVGKLDQRSDKWRADAKGNAELWDQTESKLKTV
ncbi:hypothetical protein S40293_04875 [Stachybotrys chartarum IBT 40293]|nr:hypothetical protein S40293_04875 [Stachybotrys chartarum IBT 40293]